MRGSVDFRRGRWRLDTKQNVGSLISNEIILVELQDCLERHCSAPPPGSVLDLGAGSIPYAPLYDRYFATSTAVDVPQSLYDTSSVDIFASADDLPFEAESFSCVVCTEVLEHCRQPGAVMAEIARVLKPGGSAFLTTPCLLPLHDMPFDYYRYTLSALNDLAKGAALTVNAIRPRGSYAAVALSVLQMPITKIWQKVAELTHLPFFHPYNPAVYVSVALPQQVYLRIRHYLRQRPTSRLARVYDKLTYYTLGYVTVLTKPVAEAQSR